MFTNRLFVGPIMGRVFYLVVAMMVLVLLASCSSSDDSGGADTSNSTNSEQASPAADDTPGASANSEADEIDACSILLAEDVEAQIGVVPTPSTDPVGQFQSCGYFETGTTFVQFQVCRCYTLEQFKESAKAGAEVLDAELTEVEGVGDEAYWYGGILWVQSGDVAFNLWISKPAYFAEDGTALKGDELDAVALPDARALGQTLVGRLP